MNAYWLGINNKPHAVVAVIVGFLYYACVITSTDAVVFVSSTVLSSAVVQTQHTTEPVTPTTIGFWLVGLLYHVAEVGIEPNFSRL